MLLLLAAWVGCTRPNPLFEPAPGDAEPVGEPSSDAAKPRDTMPPPPPDAAAPVPDAMAARDLAIPVVDAAVPDAAADARPPADAGSADAIGLIGYWSFDEAKGATAGDRSGNGNTGTLAVVDPNTAWKPGHAATSLEVPNTVGAGVTVKPSPSIDAIRSGLTIAAWVYRTTSINNRNLTVLSRQVGNGSREVYSLAFENDVLVLWLYAVAPAAEVSVRGNRTTPIGLWAHVAATWDGTMVRLYQNGGQIGQASYAGPAGMSDRPLILGNNANSTGLDQPLGGLLDEVRLYDRALTPSEIATLAR